MEIAKSRRGGDRDAQRDIRGRVLNRAFKESDRAYKKGEMALNGEVENIRL